MKYLPCIYYDTGLASVCTKHYSFCTRGVLLDTVLNFMKMPPHTKDDRSNLHMGSQNVPANVKVLNYY